LLGFGSQPLPLLHIPVGIPWQISEGAAEPLYQSRTLLQRSQPINCCGLKLNLLTQTMSVDPKIDCRALWGGVCILPIENA